MDQNAAKMNNIKDSAEKEAQAEAKRKSKRSLLYDDRISALDLDFMSEADAAILRRGKPRTYLISLLIVLFFAAMLTWAGLTRLDEVTKGQGQVVPAQAIQEIQYLEGGVLDALLVKQGDDVDEGQIVARISNVLAESTLREQKDNQASLEADILRLRAEREGRRPEFPAEMSRHYPQMVRGQMDLYTAHMDQRHTELRTLQAELEQRRREVAETEERINSIRSNLEIAVRRRDMAKPLLERRSYSPMDYANLEQSVVSLNGELATAVQTLSRVRSSVTAAEERMNSRRLEWQSTIQQEMNEKSVALNSVTALLAARGDAVKRTDLRSPVRGKIKRILANTLGGSIAPGSTIMEILPNDDQLLIEARVSPADRAFLHTSLDPSKKQRAVVKLTAYDFAIYGGLDATLESISDDTFEDQRGEIYYQVKLLTTDNAIHHNGKDHEIMPGMVAQVDIITGKKTVLDYLLKPILKAQQNALRER